MKTNTLREQFLNFFKNKKHAVVPAGSLIPVDDPTLLFTNAGMVPFKDVFLGLEKRDYVRATSAQPCVRAGGKHNDLENVGYTARHHTFFEMLGNFSFGDYFKREAIQMAWDFLTVELKIPKEKLWVTVFREDDEAADIWLNEIKADPRRFSRCDEADNFWSMGDTGPCGPCSEIFYDHGEAVAGGPPGTPEQEGDRYVEIWNLVFMQYNRDKAGQLTPLPKPSVDTGMGLERIAAVMQGVHSNYDTDTFQALIKAIEALAPQKEKTGHTAQVIADHIRSAAFLILEGMTPSNEHRGYVLRRIIRRALRHGQKIGLTDPFFYKLVKPLVHEMGEAYPALKTAQKRIEDVLKREEEQFIETLAQGLSIFSSEVKSLKDKVLPGELVFRLYDTYGFPPDLTEDLARENNLSLDHAGFEACMKTQRMRSQQSSQFAADEALSIQTDAVTDFTGYENHTGEGTVVALFSAGKAVDVLNENDEGVVILNKTPFYAESGGQVGDKGILLFKQGEFQVLDTRKKGKAHLHHGLLKKGSLKTGDQVEAVVDTAREAIMLNHSATHLLHAALRDILGDQVIQKGSLVEAARLRFDFAYSDPLSADQIDQTERLVNQKIRENLPCHIDIMSPDEAIKKGALALFGEKYDAKVRMLSMGDFSKELCGGTHVSHTGQIGLFKITNETGIASGVRRIEAVTGEGALNAMAHLQSQMKTCMALLKANRSDLVDKLKQTLKTSQQLEKALAEAKQKLAKGQMGDVSAQFKAIEGVHVLAVCLEGIEMQALRGMMDDLKSQHEKAVILLATVQAGKVHLVAGVTKACTDTFKAGELMRFIAEQIDGKGGGRPDMAQGGGNNPDALPKALASVDQWVKEQSQ